MGTSSLYKGPKSSALLPSDFAEEEEEGKLSDETSEEADDNTSDDAQDSSDVDDEEKKQFMQHYSLQTARRNFTKSFGGGKSDFKSTIRKYVKALGGAKRAARQDRKARQVAGGIYYLLSGTQVEIRKKLEDAGISVANRPVREVLGDIILYLAPPADNLEDSLVTDSLSEAMSELADVIDISVDSLDVINHKLMETLLSKFVKCYIFNKIMRDLSYGTFKKSDSTKEIKDGETKVKEYVEALVDAVLPSYFKEDVRQDEINKVIVDMYEACYKEAERM